MSNIYQWLKDKQIVMEKNHHMDTAFVHSSYVNENKSIKEDNERLEFIGDAVLQIYTSTKLFAIAPALNEGQMTLFRSKLVSEPALASYVRELGISKFIKLGVGEEKSGGRDRDSILADLFEAFIGAYYLNKGMECVFAFLDECIGSYFTDASLALQEDFKTRLQEFVQSDSRKTVEYEVVKTLGPSNSPLFEVVVKLDEMILGHGKGASKKKAEQEAAKNALHKLAK